MSAAFKENWKRLSDKDADKYNTGDDEDLVRFKDQHLLTTNASGINGIAATGVPSINDVMIYDGSAWVPGAQVSPSGGGGALNIQPSDGARIQQSSGGSAEEIMATYTFDPGFFSNGKLVRLRVWGGFDAGASSNLSARVLVNGVSIGTIGISVITINAARSHELDMIIQARGGNTLFFNGMNVIANTGGSISGGGHALQGSATVVFANAITLEFAWVDSGSSDKGYLDGLMVEDMG